MKPNPMDKMLTRTKDLVKTNVIEKSKDLGLEISRALGHGQTQQSLQNKIVYGLTLIIVCYFAIMDILTYFHIQTIPIRKKDPVAFEGGFDYFAMLSVKGMMEDQLSCHINWPTCELFEMGTHISQSPIVTPNAVSLFGAIIAIPAAKLLSMESLLAKRIGILVFVFRLWIDGLDGIVFRMQKFTGADQHMQQSVRHSSGWYMDFFCDLFAALMFLVGVFYTIKQCMPKQISNSNILSLLPLTACPPSYNSATSSPRPSSPSFERSERELSNRTVAFKLLWVTLCTFAGSGMWDYFVAQYRAVFEVTFPTAKQQVLQNKILKSGSTFLIFWFWRLLNGVSIINTAYLAVVYDKLWEFVMYLPLFGTSSLLLLAMMTLIHLNSIHNALELHGN